jgi:hypothetical protein
MTIARAAVAAAALLLVAACGGSGDFVDTATVEKDVRESIDGPGDVKVESVNCPDDKVAEVGSKFTCPYNLADGTGGEITVTVQTDDGAGSWVVTRPASGQAEENIRVGYEKQTKDTVKSVKCGDPLKTDAVTVCDVELDNGKKGKAQVTVVDGKIRWQTN